MKNKNFYKDEPHHKIWWVDAPENIGVWEFSFDKKKIFNLYEDYPHNLTKEQREIFDRENPDWKEFFADRRRNFPPPKFPE